MNNYDIALNTIKEAIKDLNIEDLARLIDQLDCILEIKCNKEI